MADDSDKTASFRRDQLPLPSLEKGNACVVIVEGLRIGTQINLEKTETIIGRTEEADVSVDDRLVSREHAKIVLEEEGDSRQYFLVDNGSTNATYLNNKQVSRALLKEGDKVRIGSTVLRFSLLDEVDAEYHKRIYDLITYDDLSGLLTIRPFYRELEREILRSNRLGLPLTLLMMDVDHFKLVNDTFGHQTGSYVLKEIGQIIRHALRYSDTAARYGGEEFIAFLPNSDLEAGHAGAERVREAIAQFAFDYNGNQPKVTISIGVSTFPQDARDVDELVRKADSALYKAKETGRNRTVIFSEGSAVAGGNPSP